MLPEICICKILGHVNFVCSVDGLKNGAIMNKGSMAIMRHPTYICTARDINSADYPFYQNNDSNYQHL